MPYKFIEGLTTADVAFEARGKNLNELFESAALAMFDIMADPKKVSNKIIKKFSLEEALEYIQKDEYVEVTPETIRLRKKFLKPIEEEAEFKPSIFQAPVYPKQITTPGQIQEQRKKR